MTRKEVYEVIDGERDYQGAMGARDIPTIEGELLLLEEYVNKARKAYTETFGDPSEEATRDQIRKIAAIAVRCMENHGAPKRTSHQRFGEGV